jgi:hypothetical protein
VRRTEIDEDLVLAVAVQIASDHLLGRDGVEAQPPVVVEPDRDATSAVDVNDEVVTGAGIDPAGQDLA